MTQMTSSMEQQRVQGKASMMVCVEALCNGRPQGQVINPCLPEGTQFNGIDGLVLCINRICDRLNYPEATFELRSFSNDRADEPERFKSESLNTFLDKSFLVSQYGKRVTLLINILYRQHGGLQGQIAANIGRYPQVQYFRSALELMGLLDEIFPASSPAQTTQRSDGACSCPGSSQQKAQRISRRKKVETKCGNTGSRG